MYIDEGRIVVEAKTDFTMKEIAESICPTVLNNIMDTLTDKLMNSNDAIRDAWEDFDSVDDAKMCLAILDEIIDLIKDDSERWFD